MFQSLGIRSRNSRRTNLGKTKRVSHMGVTMPKPIEASIKFIPKMNRTEYSNRPRIRNKPPISSVYVVNQTAHFVTVGGMPLF